MFQGFLFYSFLSHSLLPSDIPHVTVFPAWMATTTAKKNKSLRITPKGIKTLKKWLSWYLKVDPTPQSALCFLILMGYHGTSPFLAIPCSAGRRVQDCFQSLRPLSLNSSKERKRFIRDIPNYCFFSNEITLQKDQGTSQELLWEKDPERKGTGKSCLLVTSETQYHVSHQAAEPKETGTVHICQFCVSAQYAESHFYTLNGIRYLCFSTCTKP